LQGRKDTFAPAVSALLGRALPTAVPMPMAHQNKKKHGKEAQNPNFDEIPTLVQHL